MKSIILCGKHRDLIIFRLLASIILTLIVSPSLGQNLVPNAGFDQVVNCQTGPAVVNSNIPDAGGWLQPTIGTADHFNKCHTTPFLDLSSPSNFIGHQEPLSGHSYAGMICYTPGWEDYREYIHVPLIEPLVQGVEYNIGFHCSLADSAKYACNGVGILLSDSQIDEPIYWELDYTPQLVAPVIEDSQNWVLVHGAFIADGGESYLTIGNFLTDQEIETGFISLDLEPRAYYYIDDVYVIDSTNIGIGAADFSSINLFPNPVIDELNIDLGHAGNGAITIYSPNGIEILRQNFSQGGIKKLDFTEYREGVYLVEIFDGIHLRTFRIVKTN